MGWRFFHVTWFAGNDRKWLLCSIGETQIWGKDYESQIPRWSIVFMVGSHEDIRRQAHICIVKYDDVLDIFNASYSTR